MRFGAFILVLALAFPVLLAPPSLAGTFEEGQAAAQQGDPAMAIAIWKPLAEAGHPHAQYWLAESYWGGWWGVPENLERRAYWHLRAAEQGHVPSFIQLGHMYALGHHFARDDRAAAQWYGRAAEAGNAAGQYALGSMYFQGLGAARDPERAFDLWRQAFAQGHEGARLELCANAGESCRE